MNYSNRQLEILHLVNWITNSQEQFFVGDPSRFEKMVTNWLEVFQSLLERKASYLLKVKEELMASDQAFNEQHPDTIKNLRRIRSLEVELALLQGSKILVMNIYTGFLDTKIMKNRQLLDDIARHKVEKKMIWDLLQSAMNGERFYMNMTYKYCQETNELKKELQTISEKTTHTFQQPKSHT